MTASLAATLQQALDDEIKVHRSCRGAQAAVHVGGGLVEASAGVTHVGVPYGPRTMWAAYCCGKLALTAAALTLVDDGEVSLDDRVGDVVSRATRGWIADLPVAALLDNSAGLHQPSMIVARVLPESARDHWVLSTDPVTGWDPTADLGYATYAPWHVLGLVVEAVTSSPFDEVVHRRVTEPLGIGAGDFRARLSTADYTDLAARISVARDGGDPELPLLAEAGAESAGEWNPAFGSYATAGGLARLVAGILADARGAGVVLSPASAEMVVRTRRAAWDVVLDRRVAYGLGSVTEMGAHGFEELPADAFGATAEGAVACCFGSPGLDVGVCLRFDRLIEEPVAADQRRRRVAQALLAAVDRDS